MTKVHVQQQHKTRSSSNKATNASLVLYARLDRLRNVHEVTTVDIILNLLRCCGILGGWDVAITLVHPSKRLPNYSACQMLRVKSALRNKT